MPRKKLAEAYAEHQHFDPALLYVTSDLTIEQIVQMNVGKRGFSEGNLRRRSATENWNGQREKYRADMLKRVAVEQAEHALEITRRQLQDARSLQSVGKGLLASATNAIQRLGGVGALLGDAPSPALIMKAIQIGDEVLTHGMSAEREMLGDTLTTEPLEITFILRPALPEPKANGPKPNGASTNGNR
jgi:hypothetical protein